MENNVIELAGQEYKIVKKGRAQAEQITAILQWLSKYADDIMGKVTDEEGNIEVGSNIFEFVNTLASIVSVDALMELFMATIGCPKQVAEDEFDLALLIEAVEALFANPTYKRVLGRFFSTVRSEETTE